MVTQIWLKNLAMPRVYGIQTVVIVVIQNGNLAVKRG